MRPLIKAILFSIISTIVISPATAYAQEGDITEKTPAIFPKIWATPKLYTNKENSFVQSINLVGRYHGQYWWAESEGNNDQDWENRRMYLGFNAKIFHNFTMEVQININDDFDPVYKGLYDAFIKWQPSDSNFSISGGRLDYVYTGMERSTSSKKIKTMERGLLIGQVMPGEVIGVYINDTVGDLSYQTGLFSGSIKDEFTDFKGGFGALFGIDYKLPLFYDTGSLHLDYLYNNGNVNNNAFKPYDNIISLWHEGKKGVIAFGIDITAATGIETQSDVLGLTLLPTCDIGHHLLLDNDTLQLAMRYHYASSTDKYGLQFTKRYEKPVTSGSGDSYNAFYIGLNYFIYQQKLKLMAGVEYFTMDNVADGTGEVKNSVNGWNGSTGIRLYF